MVEISGLTVQLDDLHKAYVTIFEEAQRQLEAIDLTDAHIYRITERLGRSDDVTRKIQSEALAQLANALKEATTEELEGEHVTSNLLDALEARIWKRIGVETKDAVTSAVTEMIEEAIPKLIEEKLQSNTAIQRGQTAEFALQTLAAYLQTVPVPPKKPQPQ